VRAIPDVVEVNFAYTTYGIENRETVSWAMVCVEMLPMPLQGRQTRNQEGRVTRSGFFPGGHG